MDFTLLSHTTVFDYDFMQDMLTNVYKSMLHAHFKFCVTYGSDLNKVEMKLSSDIGINMNTRDMFE